MFSQETDKRQSRSIHWVRNLLLVSVPALAALWLILEIVFTYVLPASELPVPIWDSVYNIMKYDPNGPARGYYSRGPLVRSPVEWHINNCGWNSAVDYRKARGQKKLLAIVGDSYVEAFQVPLNRSLASVARRLLHDKYDVYSFGVSGAALATYLNMARYVHATFHPDIMVFTVVHNDFDKSLCQHCEMPGSMCLKVLDGRVEEEVKPPVKERQALFKIYRYSALVRYIRFNLGLGAGLGHLLDREWHYGKRGGKQRFVANVDSPQAMRDRSQIRTAVRYIIRACKKEFPGTTILFMIDAPRQQIYKKIPLNSPVRWMNTMLREECERERVSFLDLTTFFQQRYARTRARFEFADNWHWNEEGHKAAAEALMRLLKSVDTATGPHGSP